MAYQIKNTRGQIVSTISDYGTNNSTSLELIGRGVSNYGLIEQSNLLHLLENFASPVEPPNPLDGQLWFDTSTSNQVLSVYYNTTWNNLITVVASSTPPTNVSGLWINTKTNSLFFASNGNWIGSSSFFVSETPPEAVLNTGLTWLMIPEYILWTYDSTITSPTPSFKRIGGTTGGTYLTGSWRMIGTQYPINAGMKSYYASVSDTSSNFHNVIVNEINNKIISVESADNFTMLSSAANSLSNFTTLDTSLNTITTNPKVYSGITLNQSVPSNVFGGLSLGVLNFDITDVVGRGENLTLRPTTPVSDSTIDLGSSNIRWRNFYTNNVYASSDIEINGDRVATQPWVNDTLSSTITLATTTTFNTSGLVTLYRRSSSSSDDILELYSNVGGNKTLVSKVEADGSIDVVGSGNLKDHGNRVVVTHPILSTEIQALNIVTDPTNNHVRITDSSNNTWDITTSTYNSNNFLSRKSKTLTNYSDGNSLVFDNSVSFPYFEYNSTGAYLSTKPYVDSVTSSTYMTNNLIIDPDTNNLLSRSSAGLKVELKAAADVTSQYVSSSLGDDINGDGSQAKPFKTIKRAVDRIPKNTTTCYINLYYLDTFNMADNSTEYVRGGNIDQKNAANVDCTSKNITFVMYGNSTYTQYGIDLYPQDNGVVYITQKPTIVFDYSITSSFGVINAYGSPGFVLSTNTILEFQQINFIVQNVDNAPATSAVYSPCGFTNWGGSVQFTGCSFKLSNLMMIAGSASTSTSVILYWCDFDITNGKAFMEGSVGMTLRAQYGDVLTHTTIKNYNGTDSSYQYKIQNFNSTIANSSGFPGLTVIDSSARIYAGLTTQNKLA